jgi:hypothetical protein
MIRLKSDYVTIDITIIIKYLLYLVISQNFVLSC